MATEQAQRAGSLSGGNAQIAAGHAADQEIDVAQDVTHRARAALAHFELHIGQEFRPVGGRSSLGRGRHSDNLRREGGSIH